MAVFGIVLSFWDIFNGEKKINNSGELAKELRKCSKDLREESAKLKELYKELQ